MTWFENVVVMSSSWHSHSSVLFKIGSIFYSIVLNSLMLQSMIVMGRVDI